MTEQFIKMECPVCKHKFSSVLDDAALEEMAIYCPGCNIKVSLEGINTTIGLAITGYISSAVMNEHIAKMQDKDWKRGKKNESETSPRFSL